MDSFGNRLPYASVQLKSNSQVGQTTDSNGNFDFSSAEITPFSRILVSFMGFKSKEISASDASGIWIGLEDDFISLDPVTIELTKPSKTQEASFVPQGNGIIDHIKKNKIPYAILGTVAILGISALIIKKAA